MTVVTFTVPELDDKKAMLLASILHGLREVRQNREVPVADYRSGPPSKVLVEAAPGAEQLRCWFNVRDMVEKAGGQAIFGWTLWKRHDGHYEAIHHAVWKRPDGLLVDVTPNEGSTEWVLFMPDARVPFDYVGLRVPPGFLLHKDSHERDKRYCWVDRDDNPYPHYVLERAKH